MTHSFTARKRLRHSFGRIATVAELPNLIEIQKNSYDSFLQIHATSDKRDDTGLQGVLKSVFPIEDFAGTATLEFVKYELDPPKFTVEECIQRDISYAAPLRVTFRLIVWLVQEETETREIKGIKEQEVYVTDIPLMTNNGTFIINGTERVIVSQMHRSPGVFFDHDHGKTHSSGKYLYNARVIPYRGSWLDFEYDAKDILNFRIDRKRKIAATTLLQALGYKHQEILDIFYERIEIKKTKKGWATKFIPEKYRGVKLERDLINATNGKIVAEAGAKMNPRLGKKLIQDGFKDMLLHEDELLEKYAAVDLIDEETGEVILKSGEPFSASAFKVIDKQFSTVETLGVDEVTPGPYIVNTLKVDKCGNQEEALIEIYKVMRPGEPPTLEAASALFESLFFDAERYDLSDVGRVKINARLGLEIEDSVRILTKEDILQILKIMVELRDGLNHIDDIDHLGNRRVRSVGELVENQFRIGLLRMERAIMERMGAVEMDTIMPHDLVNSKQLASVLKDFFGSSQLSQFMDQTNPLSEITHKRRLSALGPGGLTRERAGFEVRDVHPTHYGRICPIETPEGPNIGLINSMATYAQINKYGFIESPYRKVVDGLLTNDVVYLSAIEEGKYTIAQANAKVDNKGKFTDDLIRCRKNGDFVMAIAKDIDFADVSPKQVVSVAASLIPFLENDDANRALMGSNMQRQAVPLMRASAPLVGTGMEEVVASDSGASVVAKHNGIVDQVDANRVVIRATNEKDATKTTGVDIYNLLKFQRSNQNTCINQRPVVKVGDKVSKGDIIADGPSTDLGELALGRNILVGFMPWNGYNFEDSILISERVVKEDVFTSIHIEEFEVMARDTKLGPEEVTRDIPNVGEENLKHLDEVGIIHIGAEVKSGDILVGKVTPKSESPMTPEEKLLRAIFGEKASDVRDSSLRVPPGVTGTVVEVRVFSRRGLEKDERSLAIEREQIIRLEKDRNDELKILEGYIYKRLEDLLVGVKASKSVDGIKSGSVITAEALYSVPRNKWWSILIKDDAVLESIERLKEEHNSMLTDLDQRFRSSVDKVQSGDDLPSGVLRMVKVFVAVKRKMQPGDKMAGRHGNKGVVSKINPVEDMPYLEDGTPLDIVLNPLGVPSRMNVGQILETHLGWAVAGIGEQINESLKQYKKSQDAELVRSKLLEVYSREEDVAQIKSMDDKSLTELARNLTNGVPIATPVFDGAKEADVVNLLEKAGKDTSGQVYLHDGRTGERFDRKVTVGYIYMLKLHHLVDDKIHARSIGPYSLVTQQPLGGKSHFGGQRFGEMECWALQAYGAAYSLQELLTVKSDDVAGRTKIYESIVKGDHSFESGVPESFNVIIKELRSLCMNVELMDAEDDEQPKLIDDDGKEAA